MTDSLTIWGTDYTGVKGFKAGAQSDGPTGKNLYNPATRVDGYYINSSCVEVAKDVCAISDYISVVPGESYVWSGISGETGSNNKRVVGYSESKTSPRVVNSVAVSGANVPYENSFTVPSGVAFIRLSFNISDGEIMVEHGTVKTNYEPYTNIATYAYVRPQGTKSITQNGTGIDVAEYATVDVNVSGGGGNDFIITVSKNAQTEEWEPDCPWAEFLSAYNGGKNIVFQTDDHEQSVAVAWEVNGDPVSEVWYSVHIYVDVPVGVSDEDYRLDECSYTWNAEGLTPTYTYLYWDTAQADATASDLLSGKIAYGQNGRITGSATERTSSDLSVSGNTVTTPAGFYSSSASASVANGTAGTPTATKGTVSNHAITVTPSVTNTAGYISGGTISGTGVSVAASELVSGTLSITENGSGIDVTNYAAVDVSISGGGVIVTETQDEHGGTIVNITSGTTVTLQQKSATPSESAQSIVPDTGYDGMSEVNISAVSSAYVGSSITRRSSTDLTVSGATVSVPAGYYENAASKDVTSGSAGTPVATKGTVSNHSVSITPSVTNTTGYIAGSTKTGTAVTVTASELVSGSETKTTNGTYDVTNLASLVVSIPIVTYYTGSSAPSSSLGSNGDIYLQTS